MVARDPKLEQALEKNAQKTEFAMALRRLRFDAGLTQEEVIRRSGLSEKQVIGLEAPYGRLSSLTAIQKYAAACGKKGLGLVFYDEPPDYRDQGV